ADGSLREAAVLRLRPAVGLAAATAASSARDVPRLGPRVLRPVAPEPAAGRRVDARERRVCASGADLPAHIRAAHRALSGRGPIPGARAGPEPHPALQQGSAAVCCCLRIRVHGSERDLLLHLRLGFPPRGVSVPPDSSRHPAQLLSVLLHAVPDGGGERDAVRAADAAGSAVLAGLPLRPALLLLPPHRCLRQLQQGVHLTGTGITNLFPVVPVSAAAGRAAPDAGPETRPRAAAAVDCGSGALVIASVFPGVRGPEQLYSRLDGRSAVSPDKLLHTGTDHLPLQARRSSAEEDRLRDACENAGEC
ncbi:hypothetical protein PO909_017633, partial [Leuciscus waleckii]